MCIQVIFTIRSDQISRSVMSDSLWPHGLQHARLPCHLPSLGVSPSSCPLSQWCHPTISSSVAILSSCPQSFPAPGSFLVSQFFASGVQSIGSASASIFPTNIQGQFSLGVTGLISLLSKGLSRVFSSTTIWKHQFFRTQPFYDPILTSLYEYWINYSFGYMDICWQNGVPAF